MTPEDQYEAVYAGIVAVATRCDGAQTKDGVGFNGQDTHFGRRIASVPFSSWTDDVKEEAARISLTYKIQIHTYTGIDVATLDVVREAADLSTNHNARQTARDYERRARSAAKADERKVDFVNGILVFSWVKGDPDFGALLEGVKALPGRRFNWNSKTNEVPVSQETIDFILAWDFPLSKAAQSAIETFKTVPAIPFGAPIHITLEGDKAIIQAPYDANRLTAVRALPGRFFNRARKVDEVSLDPALLVFAAKFNLNVHPAVVQAISAPDGLMASAKAAQGLAECRTALLRSVSRLSNPEDLPASFVALVQKAIVR